MRPAHAIGGGSSVGSVLVLSIVSRAGVRSQGIAGLALGPGPGQIVDDRKQEEDGKEAGCKEAPPFWHQSMGRGCGDQAPTVRGPLGLVRIQIGPQGILWVSKAQTKPKLTFLSKMHHFYVLWTQCKHYPLGSQAWGGYSGAYGREASLMMEEDIAKGIYSGWLCKNVPGTLPSNMCSFF